MESSHSSRRSSGSGRPASTTASRARLSPGESTPVRTTQIALRARTTPRRPNSRGSTACSSSTEQRPACTAASISPTMSRRGWSRERSARVRATVVARTPLITVTSISSSRQMRRCIPCRELRLRSSRWAATSMIAVPSVHSGGMHGRLWRTAALLRHTTASSRCVFKAARHRTSYAERPRAGISTPRCVATNTPRRTARSIWDGLRPCSRKVERSVGMAVSVIRWTVVQAEDARWAVAKAVDDCVVPARWVCRRSAAMIMTLSSVFTVSDRRVTTTTS
jgi:hypothetical protein